MAADSDKDEVQPRFYRELKSPYPFQAVPSAENEHSRAMMLNGTFQQGPVSAGMEGIRLIALFWKWPEGSRYGLLQTEDV